MEIIRLGEYNPYALKQKIMVQPLENAIYIANNARNNFACLKRLDFLLGFLEKKDSIDLQKYVENLSIKFKLLVKKERFYNIKTKINEILTETIHLKNYPKLAELLLNLNFQLLKLPEDFNWVEEIFETKQVDYIRSFLIPNYYYLEVLIETIGKEQAINLYKRYISLFLDKENSLLPMNFVSLSETFKSRKNSCNNPSDWIIVIGLMSESKYIFRNDNCLWIDALKDLPDKAIKYYICCYGDYQIANTTSDGNVILTMEHTIAKGDTYCSRVKHDTRLDWNLDHPKKETFDKLWSLPK